MIDVIYCINLIKEIERKKHCEKEFSNQNLKNIIYIADNDFIAKTKEDRINGCSKSHYKAITDAYNKKYNIICIFEDDIVFENSFSTTHDIIKNINKINLDWEIIFIGGNPRTKLINVEKNIYIPTIIENKWNIFRGAFGYIVSNKGIEHLIKLYKKHENKKINFIPWDGITSEMCYHKNCYVIYPYIVTTKPCKSIIQNAFVDYKTPQEQQWKKMT